MKRFKIICTKNSNFCTRFYYQVQKTQIFAHVFLLSQKITLRYKLLNISLFLLSQKITLKILKWSNLTTLIGVYIGTNCPPHYNSDHFAGGNKKVKK